LQIALQRAAVVTGGLARLPFERCNEQPKTLRTRAMMREFCSAAEEWEDIESGIKLDAANRLRPSIAQ